MMERPKADDDLGDYYWWYNPPDYMVQSDAVLVQPVGFVWWGKPKFRVKAISRKRDVGET